MGKRYVTIDKLEPEMVVAKGLYNYYGKALVKPGATIRSYGIDALRQRGIKGLYIVSDGPDEDDFPFMDAVSDAAARTIEDQHEDDPEKLEFSNEVKERISVGIEYLYNNIETPEMDRTAADITREIMDAMDHNNAIALDLNVLKASDEYTFKHSVDVATIAMIVAKHLGYEEKDIYDVGISALLHDVGKSRVPLHILNKAGKLDDDEFEIMKKHSIFSYQILKERGTYSDVICVSVLQHHEKINGKGYPFGHTAERITPYARLISIADIYDALVTDRPYKRAYEQGEALEMVMSLTDDIDKDVMHAFLSSIILYPVGCSVRLSTGEIARVVKNYENTPLRPKVVEIRSGKIYNLHEDMDCAHIVINGIIR